MVFDLNNWKINNEDAYEKAHTAYNDLASLWPLTDAEQLSNDVHYGDNLQVKQTLEIAKLILADKTYQNAQNVDITIADAEYVFEGAIDIPGRDQEIVDALLAANDAYDTARELENEFGAMQIVQIAACLSAGDSVSADLNALDAVIDEVANFEQIDDPVANLLRGYQLGLQSSLTIAQNSADPVCRAALVILVANEYLAVTSSPRTFASAQQLSALADNGLSDERAAELVNAAAEQWEIYRREILWNKDEAKRIAKEEDERKSKEALAAKFAHIKDDPNKEEVEL